MPRLRRLALFAALVGALLIACSGARPRPSVPATQAGTVPGSRPAALRVVAVETFLADLAQNVAGDRLQVGALMPLGVDPHEFEPTPGDVKSVAESDVLIVNGGGLEAFLDKLLSNAGGKQRVIQAAAGLRSREKSAGEPPDEAAGQGGGQTGQGDPHFWFDPTLVIHYVENIRDGLSQADPEGASVYRANADGYIEKLKALDQTIKQQVGVLRADQRKLVTDHDTFGYFADRYGFEMVGMLIPSLTTADTTTAKQLAELIDRIKASRAKAIFIEQGANPQVANQVARDTGVRVVAGLYTHSLSAPDGPAPTYLKMVEYDAKTIVDGLK